MWELGREQVEQGGQRLGVFRAREAHTQGKVRIGAQSAWRRGAGRRHRRGEHAGLGASARSSPRGMLVVSGGSRVHPACSVGSWAAPPRRMGHGEDGPPAPTQRSSFCTSRNLGCIESRSHSNSTISDVTTSAPCARMRSSRGVAVRRITRTDRVRHHHDAVVVRQQVRHRLQHADMRLDPRDNDLPRARRQQRGVGHAREPRLLDDVLRVRGQLGHRRPEPGRADRLVVQIGTSSTCAASASPGWPW